MNPTEGQKDREEAQARATEEVKPEKKTKEKVKDGI